LASQRLSTTWIEDRDRMHHEPLGLRFSGRDRCRGRASRSARAARRCIANRLLRRGARLRPGVRAEGHDR
jgi:hypothetical protein